MTELDLRSAPAPAGVGTSSRQSGGAPWWRWVQAHPGLVLALVAPILVFGIPQLFGLTYLAGDNFIQNFPMRVLVGKDLDHGMLPLWNPYLFSGTPLLGGFNAGAAYPLTWLTAVLPIFTAWTLTLVAAYEVALVGMYLFLRRQGIASTAATFGAVTFSLAGYMTAQQVHIDLIAGAAWLPWILLAIHGLTERPAGPTEPAMRPQPARWWVLVLATALGLTLLAGAAEAIIDSGVLVGIYWIWRLASQGYLRRGSGRALAASVAAAVAGLAAGVAVGAAQWLPGLAFLSQSQRATPTYVFFTSGSLDHRLLALIASPFALGTNQGWPATYVGTYNFPEVTSYVGILALIAGFSLPMKRWRRRPEARQWWIWYGILIVGVLSSLGDQTPFARLMYLIPGVNSERLLNRNLLLVDMALAVLVAWWLHLLLTERAAAGPAPGRLPAGPGAPRARWRERPRAEVVVTAVPFAFTVVVAVLLWLAGPFLGRVLETQYQLASGARLRLAGLVTAGVVIAGAATWTVLAADRFSVRRLRRQLAVVLVADLALFNLFVINPPITEAAALAHTTLAAQFAAATGAGRFIVYDPDRFETQELYALGQTDLNIYRQLPSAQGYTALTDGGYVAATGSHLQETLDPTTLAGPVWDRLNVSTLFALPGYFMTPLPAAAVQDRTTNNPSSVFPANQIYFPGNPTHHTSTALGAPTLISVGRSARPWYFGGALTLRSFSVPFVAGRASDLRVGRTDPDRHRPLAAGRRRPGPRRHRRGDPGPSDRGRRDRPRVDHRSTDGRHSACRDPGDRRRLPRRSAAVRRERTALDLPGHGGQLRGVPQHGRAGVGLGPDAGWGLRPGEQHHRRRPTRARTPADHRPHDGAHRAGAQRVLDHRVEGHGPGRPRIGDSRDLRALPPPHRAAERDRPGGPATGTRGVPGLLPVPSGHRPGGDHRLRTGDTRPPGVGHPGGRRDRPSATGGRASPMSA